MNPFGGVLIPAACISASDGDFSHVIAGGPDGGDAARLAFFLDGDTQVSRARDRCVFSGVKNGVSADQYPFNPDAHIGTATRPTGMAV